MENPSPSSATQQARRIADHVPSDLVVEFDGYRPMNGASFYHQPYSDLHGRVPHIFW